MSLSSSLLPSRGFHFEYLTDLSSLRTARPECDLYLLHVLPADVFVDKYELKEHGLVFNLHGESNLELPLAAVGMVGSTLEVRVPPSMKVNIPLHARYPLPSASRHSVIRVPEPQAYWACRGSSESGTNPFSHLTSPYVPSLDLDLWSITFSDTRQNERFHEIHVPAGRHADAMFVEFGTVFVVLAAFFYVLRVVWMTTMRLRRPSNLKRE